MTELEFAMDLKYRIPKDAILHNRRAYHYFRLYVLGGHQPKILGRAYIEIGPKGITRIAGWLGREPGMMVAIARKGVRKHQKEAM